jgi:hypothetical protein
LIFLPESWICKGSVTWTAQALNTNINQRYDKSGSRNEDSRILITHQEFGINQVKKCQIFISVELRFSFTRKNRVNFFEFSRISKK